ncbi:uncharacterized protein LOC123272275 [Cotesia glomerata]|uniref:uncharacterized protein LOC123272275 n=1 Tax=Cotesia glomerata TaxID=32391 RepID=UPI001D0226AE|nr:uncharacterized protein LOC123272275 [Cotesia glomerata]
MDKSVCGCDQPKLVPSQYYQEVGAELLGNKIRVRIERDKNKLSKLKKLKEKSKEWDPPCVCLEVNNPKPPKEPRIQGPKIINVGDSEIIFRLNSRCRLSCEDQNYSSQLVSSGDNFKLAISKPKKQDDKIQVFSRLDHLDKHDVYQDHATVIYPKIKVFTAPPPSLSPPAAISPAVVPPAPPEVKLPEVEVIKPEKKYTCNHNDDDDDLNIENTANNSQETLAKRATVPNTDYRKE